MILWVGLFLSLFILQKVSQGQVCLSDKECNRDIVKCGLCNEGQCTFPFNNIYNPSKLCNFNTNKCKDNSCGIGLVQNRAFEGYSTCVCECSVGWYGQYCEIKGNSAATYTSGVQLIAPTFVEFLKDYSVFITVQEQGTVQKDAKGPVSLTMLLTTVSGSFGAVSTLPTLKKTTTKNAMAFCKLRSWDPGVCQFFRFNEGNGINLLFDVSLRVPFDYIDELDYWSWKKTDTLILKIIYEGHELYSLNQEFILKDPFIYQSKAAVPKIYNCGKNIETPLLISRDQDTYLTGRTFTRQDNDGDKLKKNPKVGGSIYYTWKAFRVEGQSQTLLPDYNFVGMNIWKIAPFSWKHGLYIIRFETHTLDLLMKYNYCQCYLKVVLKPLVAKIDGGVKVCYSAKMTDGLVLNPAGSHDPNQPLGQSKLRFTVSCDWTDEAVCQRVYRDSLFYDGGLDKPPIHYSPRSYNLEEGKVYKFTLKVELGETGYKLQPAYDYQLITVRTFPLDLTLKSIEVECLYNCDSKVNPQDIVYLKIKGPWEMLDKIEKDFHWRVSSYEAILINSEKMRQNKTPNYIFIVSRNTLREDSTYQFEVVYKNTDLLAIYELITSKPSETICNVTPSQGIIGQTTFKVNCNSTGFVRSYEFYEKKPQGEIVGAPIGRMIASQEVGDIEVFLTKEQVEVHIFGEAGLKTITSVNIGELSPGKLINEQVKQKIAIMKSIASTGGYSVLFRSVSLLNAIMLREEKYYKYYEDILTLLNMVPDQTFADAKLCLNTLHQVIVEPTGTLKFNEVFQATVTLETISRTLIQYTTKHKDCQVSFNDLYNIFE